MSDLNQISKDTTNTNEQQEISLINDDFKTISISDQKILILENHAVEVESYDETDSEYEDVEDDEIIDTSVLTSITNKSPLKATINDDEIHINIKPRRTNKKHEDDEHSEGYEDENDHQNVPKTNVEKNQSTKIKEQLKDDDDNNTQSPAYIPRKGKFYEHDDRTLDEDHRSKQEISRNEGRLYKDSDAKWQHDLYFQDEQTLKSRHSIPRRVQSHFEHRNDYNREPVHSIGNMSRSSGVRRHYQNDYHRRIPPETEKKTHSSRTNNFDFKDYNRNGFNRDLNIQKEKQQQQQHDYNPYQIDERTFHRRRNFTNSQFQQHGNVSKFKNNSSNSNDQRQFNKDNYRHYEELRKYELSENKTNLPPRLRINNTYQNLTQKQEYQQNLVSNSSINGSNIERPKRYSNMRNNITNPIQQQVLSSSQIKHYQGQHSNKVEQNDWPQAPPPPTSYLPQQLIIPQIYYQQQTSRYVPMNYSQASISEQFQDNK